MPKYISVRWRIAGTFFLVIFALILMLGLYLLNWTEDYYLRSLTTDLTRENKVVGRFAADIPAGGLPGITRDLGRDLNYRVTIIAPDGRVLADSEKDFRKMENHANRPEVREAIAAGYGKSQRYSSTLQMDMLYVASTFKRNGKLAGVARVAEPLSGLQEVMTAIQRTFIAAALLAVILAALVSVKLASRITDRIERVSSVARKLASGDLSARVSPVEGSLDETSALALTFNSMAERLQSMVREITEQRSRMQTILDHTDDGLLLVDHQDKIQMINPAACRLLGIASDQIIGKTIIEGTLNHDLAALVSRVHRTREPAALEIILPNVKETALHVYVAPLEQAEGTIGALAVLHDVTAGKKVEAIRRDFIANVSHELRTPLASIKAMAETILLRHKSDPSAALLFAGSIVQEADRMTLLADDLLDLAAIEAGRKLLQVENVEMGKLIEDVVERIRPAAKRKSIHIESNVTEGVSAIADKDSLIQILFNLVDNAVKYSREGDKVLVSAERINEQTSISVTDTGIGIPEEDLPRIFERFYRVDKARSRESGGTGLGLSIVKHLTELMGGKISVTSEPGKGSTFTLLLPAAKSQSNRS